MGRGRGRDPNRGQSVESREARARDNDPDAVEMRRDGGVDHEEHYIRTQGVRRGPGVDDVVVRRDSARWGPIWVGLITALTTFLLLELLAIGIGLQDVGPGGGDGWVPAIIGLIAFFTGGAVAGMTSAVKGASTGLLNGFLVWALGTTLILVLSALGLGQIFGALGDLVGQLGVLQNGVVAPDVDVNPAQVAETIRDAAIGTFFGLLLSAVAAALGGWLGGRTRNPIGHMANDG